MIKNSKLILCLLLATLALACSKEEEEDINDLGHGINYSDASYRSHYTGVWTVDDVLEDAAFVDDDLDNTSSFVDDDLDNTSSFVDVNLDKAVNDYNAFNYVCFYGFPYQTIINKIFPGQIFKELVHFSNMVSFRIVGYSEEAAYFEFYNQYTPFENDLRDLYFEAELESGKEVIVALHIVPGESNAIYKEGKSFSCILSIEKIIGYEKMGTEEVKTEKRLEPELKLKFTSIQKI